MARQHVAPAPPSLASEVEALAFDVFGTVVDWRGSIVREGRALSRRKGLEVDWGALADRWRAGYRPAMDRIRSGAAPWATIDEVHRSILEELLDEFGLGELRQDEIDELNRAWHRLAPWPDAVSGLLRLRERFILSTLSNGNVALLTRMAKNAGLPWDVILSAELAGTYKPDPAVYRTAADLLDLPPERILMVAAHPGDLRAAARVGFRTAWVPRPLEHGVPSGDGAPISSGTKARGTKEEGTEDAFDLTAADFLDLARQVGA